MTPEAKEFIREVREAQRDYEQFKNMQKYKEETLKALYLFEPFTKSIRDIKLFRCAHLVRIYIGGTSFAMYNLETKQIKHL